MRSLLSRSTITRTAIGASEQMLGASEARLEGAERTVAPRRERACGSAGASELRWLRRERAREGRRAERRLRRRERAARRERTALAARASSNSTAAGASRGSACRPPPPQNPASRAGQRAGFDFSRFPDLARSSSLFVGRRRRRLLLHHRHQLHDQEDAERHEMKLMIVLMKSP